MLRYKDDVIAGNTKGIEFLFKKNKVTWLKGWGSIPEAGKVKVGDEVHNAKNIVIATGSESSVLPGITIDEEVIVTSTGALTLPKIPKTMVVIGAGVIGLEMGSVYARLGAQVTVVEYLDAITPGMDAEVAKSFQRILAKQGLKFVLGRRAGGGTQQGRRKVAWKARKDDKPGEVEADVVLVATGRKPYTAGLGLEALGSRWARAARSKPMIISAPISMACMRSAMPSPADAGPQGRRRRHGRCGNHGRKARSR